MSEIPEYQFERFMEVLWAIHERCDEILHVAKEQPMTHPISDNELDSLETNVRQAGGKWATECLQLILEIRIMKLYKQADDECFAKMKAIDFKQLDIK